MEIVAVPNLATHRIYVRRLAETPHLRCLAGIGTMLIGAIERGVPQAYIRARAPSATLCSVHSYRVFLCIFYIKKGICYVSKRAWIHI